MRDVLYIIGELIILIISIPLVLIGAIILGLMYFIYCLYEFIKIMIFDK